MARPFQRNMKPWGVGVVWPGDDYSPVNPLPDLRLEQFAILVARNSPKTRAVITAFPNASYASASYRAAKILGNDGVRARIAQLRRAIVGTTGDCGLGDIHTVAGVPDASKAIVATGGDNSGQALDNLGHSDGECPKMSKRRGTESDDLTISELRAIISRGARDGQPAAIQAAIRMLDASLSAPPAISDPAGLCSILFNGGGGGETLLHIVTRLSEVFGMQSVADTVHGLMSHNKDYVAYIDNARARGNTAQDAPAQADTHASQDAVREGAGSCEPGTCSTGASDTPGTGEGGEPAPAQDVYVCSENFEPTEYTKPESGIEDGKEG